MPQFDVFDNPSRASKATFPYLVVLQSDISIGRNNVVVAPIARRSKVDVEDRAIIPVTIGEEDYVVIIHGVTSMPSHALKKPVARVEELGDQLPRAIDYLFLGM